MYTKVLRGDEYLELTFREFRRKKGVYVCVHTCMSAACLVMNEFGLFFLSDPHFTLNDVLWVLLFTSFPLDEWLVTCDFLI